MADAAFLQAQRDHVYDPQVLAVNSLVDELKQARPGLAVPFVAPHYTAANARILALSSNPGPRAAGDSGSGLLSRENDDPSAERMSRVLQAVGLGDADSMPWNAYPWYVHDNYPDGLPPALLAEGLQPFAQLLERHPNIQAIVAHGGDAKRFMRLFTGKKRYLRLLEDRGIQVWETRHTSNRAFILSKVERALAMEKMAQTYREAMTYVGLVPLPARGGTTPPARKKHPSGAELVGAVGDALSAITDGQTDHATRVAVRTYLGTMTPHRRTELLVELVTQRLNS